MAYIYVYISYLILNVLFNFAIGLNGINSLPILMYCGLTT